jgi:glycine/D-amino acid oxidase-like deaminating enzyme/nitrite reductase/ring-hydroxylating ferredoxin subunit
MSQDFSHSIWQDQPVPSRPALDSDLTADVCVVGAGITGLTAALRLLRTGARVVVVEADRIGAGTSGKTTAHFTAVYDHDYALLEKVYGGDTAGLVARSLSEAIDAVERTVEAEAIDCDFRRVSGWLYTESPEDEHEIEQEMEAALRAGLDVAASRNVPLPFQTAFGFEARNQAQLHIMRYLSGLAEAIERHGGRICEGTRVAAIEEGKPCLVRTTRSAPSASGPHGHTILARDIVLATHIPLGRSIIHAALPPYRSFVMAVKAKVIPNGLFWDNATPYNYLRNQRTDDGVLLIVGGKDRKTGHGRERDSFSALEAYVRTRFDVESIVARWSAQFYDTLDHLPYIGRRPMSSHVSIATGFSGDGMTFGTLAGHMLADQIAGRVTPYDKIYEPARIHLMAGLKQLIHENLDNAKSFLGDRLPKPRRASFAGLGPGDGAVVGGGWAPIAAFRDDTGALHTFSAVCPHMKCVVRWNADQKSFDCPCHGSRFSTSGAPLEGPSLAPLAPTQVEDDRAVAKPSQIPYDRSIHAT